MKMAVRRRAMTPKRVTMPTKKTSRCTYYSRVQRVPSAAVVESCLLSDLYSNVVGKCTVTDPKIMIVEMVARSQPYPGETGNLSVASHSLHEIALRPQNCYYNDRSARCSTKGITDASSRARAISNVL